MQRSLFVNNPVCGECNFCVKDDGLPYCVCKDLYTTVELSQKCDETDIYGNLMFAQEKGK